MRPCLAVLAAITTLSLAACAPAIEMSKDTPSGADRGENCKLDVYYGEYPARYRLSGETEIRGSEVGACTRLEVVALAKREACRSGAHGLVVMDLATAEGIIGLRRCYVVAAGFLTDERAASAAKPGAGTGTGWFVASDVIVTAAHVVEQAQRVQVKTPDGRTLDATVLSRDPGNDVALLSVPGAGGKPLAVVSEPSPLGATVVAAGFPISDVLGQSLKVTQGAITSLAGIQDDPTRYQISASIQPGNSGGPLLNDRGQVIGVLVSRIDPVKSMVNAGTSIVDVNYATKSTYLTPLLQGRATMGPTAGPTLKPEELAMRAMGSTVQVLINQ